jgi:hypothetical protein
MSEGGSARLANREGGIGETHNVPFRAGQNEADGVAKVPPGGMPISARVPECTERVHPFRGLNGDTSR